MHNGSTSAEHAADDASVAAVVLREVDVRRALTRIAHEIAERNASESGLCIVGIHRRGAFLARRLRDALSDLLDCELPLGDLDIGFYRDDVARRPDSPILHASHIDFDITGRTVVIVDDVLFTGRTVRAAIEALFDYGRPQRVQLAVLVDRGHRELPVRPDYVGKNLPTSIAEHVHVRVAELDGRDEVAIAAAAGARA
jgi:pyrimidine operon attenuation protein/uracil phosphoribosyltransferase